MSLQTGDPEHGLHVHLGVQHLHGRDLGLLRRSSCARSATRATATILCLIIAFPLAYFIAFKAGRFKNLMLLLIILPFFMSYVLRTVAWQLILSDNGWVVERLRDVGLLATTGACWRRARR